MAKMFKVGNYKFETKEMKLTDLLPDEEIVGPEPDHDFILTIESIGIVYPIIMTEVDGKLHLIDGGRRIKAARILGLETINVNIFQDVSPLDKAAWSIILNEQRSVNPVSEYLYYKELKARENWSEISKQYRINKSHMDKVMSLDNLIDETFISGYRDGKISTSTLFEIAKLGEPRQKYLVGVLDTKGKIAQSDVKEARKARQTAVLEASADHFTNMNMTEQADKAPAKLYATLSSTDIEHADVQLFADFHQAWQYKLEHGNGTKMFQLVEV